MGATGLTDDGNTITFRNLRVNPQGHQEISFYARVNYFEEDKMITTEPEFISLENKSISKSPHKEIKISKLTAQEIKKSLENRGVVLRSQNSREK